MSLPPAFLTRPIAHRGLHGPKAPENSRAAFSAAIAAGYGIELDLQLSADGAAMVFHDAHLDRLTSEHGAVKDHDAKALAALTLKGGREGIPTLREVLDLVAGRVALLIEIKDQDGALGPNIGALEAATAQTVQGYVGPLAVMSFNPHSMARMADLAPDTPRGLTTCAFPADDWPQVPADRRKNLAEIPDFERVGADFISHQASDLANPRIAQIKARGANILTWTIRSPKEEAKARRVADNITFESYAALDPRPSCATFEPCRSLKPHPPLQCPRPSSK